MFFFINTPTPEIYTLSLHDALPILYRLGLMSGAELDPRILLLGGVAVGAFAAAITTALVSLRRDRKSTRLNSSHITISYAVFCLKKKKKKSTTCRQSRYVYCSSL